MACNDRIARQQCGYRQRFQDGAGIVLCSCTVFRTRRDCTPRLDGSQHDDYRGGPLSAADGEPSPEIARIWSFPEQPARTPAANQPALIHSKVATASALAVATVSHGTPSERLGRRSSSRCERVIRRRRILADQWTKQRSAPPDEPGGASTDRPQSPFLRGRDQSSV